MMKYRKEAGVAVGIVALCAAFAQPARSVPPGQNWKPAPAPLLTRWAKDVVPTAPLPEYPRPQMARAKWQNLNGLWDYALAEPAAEAAPATYAGRILVPFPYESALSGVGKPSEPGKRLWYRRSFTVPADWTGQRILLHFGAVNWDSTVAVNGKTVGAHRGGYDGFSFDITDALKPGANELSVSAHNPLFADVPNAQVLGKQRVKAGGIFYTAATGIWQTVWLEPVPVAHVETLKLTPDLDKKAVHVTVKASGGTGRQQVRITATDGSRTVVSFTGNPGDDLIVPMPAAHLWTPEDPHLYSLKVALFEDGKPVDSVDSYFAMRKISLSKDTQGRTRLFLNNKFVLQVGALDQGYWPDGIYTAPTDAALRYDVEMAKKFGFNMLRKHAKVEPSRWYYHTDKLGILVWQDMPQAFGDNFNDAAKAQFKTELREMLAEFHNHPSIVVWTTFNEGWGQHDTPEIVALTKSLDPSRLVNNASGWTDKNVGDMVDSHDYPGPGSPKPEPTRAAVNGEFGGVTLRIPGHMWTQDVFGYGATLKNEWQVTKRYQDLMKKAYVLAAQQGTSAFVYTQLTDVEQESNGLLTYDRAVIKADLKIVAAADKGQFLPLPPNPNPNLLETSQDTPQAWQYSFEKPADNWFRPGFEASAWKTGNAPFGREVGGPKTEWNTPDIWLRREVTLGQTIPAKLAFEVFHDEDVEIYVNGVLAATGTGYTNGYVALPLNAEGRAALKPGKNLIAVHCRQTRGGQAIDVGISVVK